MILRPHYEEEPRALDHVRLYLPPAEAPGECVGDSPAPHALVVETELGREHVEPAPDSSRITGTAEQPATVAEERRSVELSLSDEGLWVDREPRFTGGAQDVPAMEILVEHNRLTLIGAELETRSDRLVEDLPSERPAERFPLTR